MRKITPLDRVLLLAAGLLAAYQVVVGVEGLRALAVASYTIGFGVLLVAGLLIIILGFEVLESSVEVIISTIIPLSLSLGLISEYLPGLTVFYLAFILLGFLAIVGTRFAAPGLIALAVLTVVHGVSGLLIFVLPILFSLQGKASPGFVFVGIGGALMGIEGLLLSFDKLGHPILCRNAILKGLPGLLLLMTAAFVVGFAIR